MTYSLPALFLGGLATFLTPCVLPLIPVYLGSLAGFSLDEAERSVSNRVKLFLGALSFVFGFTVVFVALGLASTFAGKALAAHRDLLLRIGGLVVFLFGLKFIGVLRLGFLEKEARLKMPQTGNLLGNLGFGVVFALGWTPCIGPVLGSVLAYTASSTTDPWTGALYLLVYSAGFAVPMLAVAALLGTAVTVLDKLKRHMKKIEIVGGAALLVIGVLLVTGNVSWFVPGGGAAAGQEACAQTVEKRASVPRMVEFKSERCEICREMEPVVDQLKKDCAGRVRIKQIVAGKPGGRRLMKKHRVVGYPTFLFLNEEGEEVARLVGRQRLRTLRQHLSLLTGEQCADVGRPQGGGRKAREPPQGDSQGDPARLPREPRGLPEGGECGAGGGEASGSQPAEGATCTEHAH